MGDSASTIGHIFAELRYYEDRARADDATRELRLGALAALSGAVLGLLTASVGKNALSTAAVILFVVAAVAFVLAILVATQFMVRLRIPLISHRFGGRLERVKEVAESEFDYYLTDEYQAANQADLQRRVLPVMRSAIGSRRRNLRRKEQSLDVASWLFAIGILAGAAYASILVL